MGITSFFPWFQKTFSRYVHYVRPGHTVDGVDNVLVDMNGIFHPAAQKTFRYGKYSKSLLNPAMPEPTLDAFYREVGSEIDRIAALVPPRRRLVLCVDGVAPVAKQIQQRQRRYKAAADSARPANFDPNSLTPGSQVMYALCEYVGEYIKKFSDIEVVWSPSSVPGEGEMKLVNFIRYYVRSGETTAIYGLDADIILLSLCVSTPRKRILVVRERDTDHAVVDVALVRKNLVEKLTWRGPQPFEPDNVITDFVFMCFFVGNDFLKRAPGVDIVTGTVERIVNVYLDAAALMGHITDAATGSFNAAALSVFIGRFAELEQSLFDTKIRHLAQYIPDPLFAKYVANGRLDLPGYRAEYYDTKFRGHSVERVCEEYLEGLAWVLGYYTQGVPSWRWYYPYNYSPFLSDVAATPYRATTYGRTTPYEQYYQLLLVLPPQSMALLPPPLDTLFEQFPDLFPRDVVLDAAGKRYEYEAEVLLPAIDSAQLAAAYSLLAADTDQRANAPGASTSTLRGKVQHIQL